MDIDTFNKTHFRELNEIRICNGGKSYRQILYTLQKARKIYLKIKDVFDNKKESLIDLIHFDGTSTFQVRECLKLLESCIFQMDIRDMYIRKLIDSIKCKTINKEIYNGFNDDYENNCDKSVDFFEFYHYYNIKDFYYQTLHGAMCIDSIIGSKWDG